MDNILVTGGAGFIGANFINFLIDKTDDHIVNLDTLTYAANKDNIEQQASGQYTFVEGDIRDKEFLIQLFDEYQFSRVVHFAAESHVDNSIADPSAFVETNITGTFHLLHTAYQLWMSKPFQLKSDFKKARFLHVSTDEVDGSL